VGKGEVPSLEKGGGGGWEKLSLLGCSYTATFCHSDENNMEAKLYKLGLHD
jgi:hypothetical protein